jgi:hypothetical protein
MAAARIDKVFEAPFGQERGESRNDAAKSGRETPY